MGHTRQGARRDKKLVWYRQLIRYKEPVRHRRFRPIVGLGRDNPEDGEVGTSGTVSSTALIILVHRVNQARPNTPNIPIWGSQSYNARSGEGSRVRIRRNGDRAGWCRRRGRDPRAGGARPAPERPKAPADAEGRYALAVLRREPGSLISRYIGTPIGPPATGHAGIPGSGSTCWDRSYQLIDQNIWHRLVYNKSDSGRSLDRYQRLV